MDGLTIATFDYAALDSESRVVVQQRATEIRSLVKRTTQDIIEIGQKLIDVKARLPRGQFDPWVHAELGLERATAYRFISVAARFGESSQIETIAPSALYTLAAPSIPDEARDEALERAGAGETITHQVAQQIIDQHRPAQDSRTVTRNGTTYQQKPPAPKPNISEVAPDSTADPTADWPPLDDLLRRLDAHGYPHVGTPRQKGMTTYHTFLNQGTGEETELAEGELPFWLADLDRNARHAEEAQAQYQDAAARFAALGWRLDRTRADDKRTFSLFKPDGAHYATTPDLAPQLRTLATFERHAVGQRTDPHKPDPKEPPPADGIPHLPPDFPGAQRRAEAIGLWLDMDAGGIFRFSTADHTPRGVSGDWPKALAMLDGFESYHTSTAQPFWQALSPAHPTAHIWTQIGPSAWRAACGVGTAKAPSGNRDGGHCSSCVRATWKHDDDPAHVEWLEEQIEADREPSARQESIAPLSLEAAAARLRARGWLVRTLRAAEGDVRLIHGDNHYATDIDGVIAAARILAEQPDLSPDALMEAVQALDPPEADHIPLARQQSFVADPLTQIRATLARITTELASLAAQLERLADAPDVGTDDYESLAHRIGDARRALESEAIHAAT